MMKLLLGAALLSAAGVAGAAAAVQVQGGTLGLGASVAFPVSKTVNARVGYAGYSMSRKVNDTSSTYDGTLKLSNLLGVLDWHPGEHSFKVSVGAIATGNKIDVVAVPVGGSFRLGGASYSTSQVSSVKGSIKVGSGVAPYVGLGLGNPLGEGSHLSFLFDLGVIFTGTPNVNLTATCAPSLATATCNQVQQSVATEVTDLRNNATDLRIWPVINVGFGWRF
jgi:hypothetical protein